MPFGCPYPKGSEAAKKYMAGLRAMRGKKAGKPALRKRSRRGGTSLGNFFKRFVTALRNPENREGDLKDRFRHFAEDMSGVREVKQQRDEIYGKLNRRQRDLLKRGIWKSASENGLPYEYFLKMTPNPPTSKTSGGAIPFFLVKLIGKLGITAALKLWDSLTGEAKERAMRVGGAWLGMDGEIHTSTVHPGMVGATRRRGGMNLNRPAPHPIVFNDLSKEDVRKALRAYAEKHRTSGGWVLPRKPPSNPLEDIAEAQRKEREFLRKIYEERIAPKSRAS